MGGFQWESYLYQAGGFCNGWISMGILPVPSRWILQWVDFNGNLTCTKQVGFAADGFQWESYLYQAGGFCNGWISMGILPVPSRWILQWVDFNGNLTCTKQVDFAMGGFQWESYLYQAGGFCSRWISMVILPVPRRWLLQWMAFNGNLTCTTQVAFAVDGFQ